MSEIAERAGVNKQLISSYYFGDNDGLYPATVAEWHEREDQLAEPGIDLGSSPAGTWRWPTSGASCSCSTFGRAGTRPGEQHSIPRTLTLSTSRPGKPPERLEEFDPGFVLLLLQMAVVASTVFPAR